jgi:hypothetical protein
MWALWQQFIDWCWGVIGWVSEEGHWEMVAGICVVLLLYMIYRRRP